jgi:hypothetical protein
MHIIARKPQPRLLQSAVMHSEPASLHDSAIESSGVARTGLFALVLGILFALALGSVAVIYWLESLRYPVVVTIRAPEKKLSQDSLDYQAEPLVPVNPDMLHVTSIALGNPRLTIVNGKRLAEGDWLLVSTPVGHARLWLMQIEDGVVRFRHGGQTISAKLQVTQKPTH